jgi:ethanolamine utilization protein EutP
MGKILLIGGIGAGKTTLKQKLSNQAVSYHKTQMLDFSSLFIDCPGEYLEIPRYYHVLVDTSHRVSEIWALQDPTKARAIYPPNFTRTFRKPVIGIITKVDLPQADIKRSIAFLSIAGIREPIYQVSVVAGAGLKGLESRLEALKEAEFQP